MAARQNMCYSSFRYATFVELGLSLSFLRVSLIPMIEDEAFFTLSTCGLLYFIVFLLFFDFPRDASSV
jgi:hypothetical protein